MGMTAFIALLVALVRRVIRRSSLALAVTAALAAAVFPGLLFSMAAVQPYYAKVLLLFFDFAVLAWIFNRFDALTVLASVFTFAFCWQNYSLLVIFRPAGVFEEQAAFVVWGLLVAAAAAVTFNTSIRAAGRRVAAAFQ